MNGHDAFEISKGLHSAPVGTLRKVRPPTLREFTHFPEHKPEVTGKKLAVRRQTDGLRMLGAFQQAALGIKP